MEILHTQVRRVRLTSKKRFDEVIAALSSEISHPDIPKLMQQMNDSVSLGELGRVVGESLGDAKLIEFLNLDIGSIVSVGPSLAPYRMIRMLVGNPMMFRDLAGRVPDSASYVPVSILIYEVDGLVNVCYDLMASLLATCDSREALRIASEIDTTILELLGYALNQ